MTARRAVAVAGAMAAMAAALVAQSSSEPQRPTFRAGANVVLVDVYPQKDGSVVEGLTARDFSVSEDGQPQVVEHVEFVRVADSLPETARRDPGNIREMYEQAADPRTRVFVAYLDTLHLPFEASVQTRRSLVTALNRIVGPDDLFGVTTTNQRAVDLTLGRRSLSVEDQLSRYVSWGVAGRAMSDANDPMELELEECFSTKFVKVGDAYQQVPWLVDDDGVRRRFHAVLIERRREDRTFSSLENLVSHLGSMREARSALLPLTRGWRLVGERPQLAQEPFRSPEDVRFADPVFSNGGDRRGMSDRLQGIRPPQDRRVDIEGCRRELERLSRLDHPRRLRELTERANRNNVSFFPVNVMGLEVFDDSLAYRDDVAAGKSVIGESVARVKDRVQQLRTLADATGGMAVVDTNDVDGGLANVARALSSYYLVAYSPTNTRRDGRFRRIDVRVARPGVVVRARQGYVAAADTATAASATPDPARLAVDQAIDALARTRTSSDFATVAAVDGTEIWTVAELGPNFIAAGWGNGAEVRVEGTAADGSKLPPVTGAIARGTRSVVVRLPVGATTGPWRVTTRLTGAMTTQDTVDAVVQPGVMLGAATVYRATPSPRAPLFPVAALTFGRNERLRVEWPVFDRADTWSARLLDRQGRALAGPLSAVMAQRDGREMLTIDLNLAPFPEGEYVVEVRGTRGTAIERKLQAFRVVR